MKEKNGKKLLLVVDVQNGFVSSATRSILPKISNLLPAYENIVATRFFNPQDSNFRRLIHWNAFARDSVDYPLAIPLPPRAEVVDKSQYSCVTDEFLRKLHSHGISEIHLCGIDTDICVTKCAVDLFEAGLTPVILAYACASSAGNEFHEAGLRILKRFLGEDQVVDKP